MSIPFTIEERSIMAMHNTDSRLSLLQSLKVVEPHIDDDFTAALVKRIIDRLAIMSDDEFAAIDFTDNVLFVS